MLARIALRTATRRRKLELERFRDDILRLFERSFALESVRPNDGETKLPPTRGETLLREDRVEREAPSSFVDPTIADSSELPQQRGEEKKRYHSIRERLLRTEEEEEESSPFRVNPIARQAAALTGKTAGSR